MLWIYGATSELSEHLFGALGRSHSSTYLMARSTWLKNWWWKQGARYLTFSYVQSRLDHTRPIGVGFQTKDARTAVSDRLQGLHESLEPMGLVGGASLDLNALLTFKEDEILKKEFLEIDKNHPAKTASTPARSAGGVGKGGGIGPHGVTVSQTGSAKSSASKAPSTTTSGRGGRGGLRGRGRGGNPHWKRSGSTSREPTPDHLLLGSDDDAVSDGYTPGSKMSGSGADELPNPALSSTRAKGRASARDSDDQLQQVDLMTFFGKLTESNNNAAERMQQANHTFLRELTREMASTNAK
eukprot:3932806-Rhodomonas_salina.1